MLVHLAVVEGFAGGVVAGEQVTGHVARRDADAAAQGHRQVRIVLAHALASLEQLLDLDADLGGAGHVAEAGADEAVQRLMNAAILDVLEQLGFVVEEAGSTACALVTALR